MANFLALRKPYGESGVNSETHLIGGLTQGKISDNIKNITKEYKSSQTAC
jgi:hypothetical protein